LDNAGVTDLMLRKERDLMHGPGGGVMRTVVAAIKDELNQLKDAIDLTSRGASSEDHYASFLEGFERIARTLVMLGLIDAANMLKDQVVHIKRWAEQGVDVEGEEFQALADALLYIENRVSMLARGPASANEGSDAAQPGSFTQLEEARLLVVTEARAGLSLAKRALTSFMDSSWDPIHLSNVPTTLHSVWGGLLFLQLERAARVLERCGWFIENRLIRDKESKPNENLMETLADAITSIDYYLESMEDRKPIGDGVLDVAEDSVRDLGVPVAA
jgi:hypothetical protein